MKEQRINEKVKNTEKDNLEKKKMNLQRKSMNNLIVCCQNENICEYKTKNWTIID